MATIDDIQRRLRSLERMARKQIKVLQKKVEQGLPPRIPIGPGPIKRLLGVTRVIRGEVNRSFAQIERALLKALARARREAQRR